MKTGCGGLPDLFGEEMPERCAFCCVVVRLLSEKIMPCGCEVVLSEKILLCGHEAALCKKTEKGGGGSQGTVGLGNTTDSCGRYSEWEVHAQILRLSPGHASSVKKTL